MSDSNASSPVRPLPKFHFVVDFESFEASFQEVTGLDTEQQLEYRVGGHVQFSTIKMPGMQTTGKVILRKGMCRNTQKLTDWINAVKTNNIGRRTVMISLLNEAGEPVIVWKLANAFPVKMTSSDLKADGNEVAIESVEIVHEGLTIQND